MDTIQFNERERAVAKERYYCAEILQINSAGFSHGEIGGSVDDFYEIDIIGERLKKSVQPFNVFKTIPGHHFENGDIELLVEYLKTYHDFAWKNAAIIYEQAQKVFYLHCENHPELITFTEVTFLFLHDLLNQMRKEECFFAHIRQLAEEKRAVQTTGNSGSEDLKNTIKSLQNDQEKALNYLTVIHQITGSYQIPFDACNYYKSLFKNLRKFEKDLVDHFYLEKYILFPKAVALADKKAVQDKKLAHSLSNVNTW